MRSGRRGRRSGKQLFVRRRRLSWRACSQPTSQSHATPRPTVNNAAGLPSAHHMQPAMAAPNCNPSCTQPYNHCAATSPAHLQGHSLCETRNAVLGCVVGRLEGRGHQGVHGACSRGLGTRSGRPGVAGWARALESAVSGVQAETASSTALHQRTHPHQLPRRLLLPHPSADPQAARIAPADTLAAQQQLCQLAAPPMRTHQC